MQFDRDIEACMTNKWKIRAYPEPERSRLLLFFRQFRLVWHQLRAPAYPESARWLQRRGHG